MRSLLLLVKDFVARDGAGPAIAARVGDMLAGMAADVAALTAAERLQLVAPIEPVAACLFADRHVVTASPALWPSLFAGLDGEPLLRMSEALFATGEADAVGALGELLAAHGKRRLLRRRDPVVELYLAAARHLAFRGSRRDQGSKPFHKLLKHADGKDTQRLRTAARELAAHVDGRLADALRGFDFDVIDLPDELVEPVVPSRRPAPMFVIDDDDDDGAVAVGRCPECGSYHGCDDEEDGLDDAIAGLELLIDEIGLRGAPAAAVREFAGDLRSAPERRRELDAVARAVSSEGHEVSPEVAAILFPRRSSARSRRRRRAR